MGMLKIEDPGSPLHVVSGPWTSIVAALDEGRSNIAVCRRHKLNISAESNTIFKNLVLQALGTIRFRFLQKNLKKIVMLVYL
jgi:hypothetical protein